MEKRYGSTWPPGTIVQVRDDDIIGSGMRDGPFRYILNLTFVVQDDGTIDNIQRFTAYYGHFRELDIWEGG